MKKEKVIVEFDTPNEQKEFLDWATQPSNSAENKKVREIREKVTKNRKNMKENK